MSLFRFASSAACLFALMFSLSHCAIEPEKRAPVTHTVVISSMQFNPSELTVQYGDTVIFINKDMVIHNVTEETGKIWQSSNLPQGHSYRLAVKASANYFCALHPVMKGKLVVQ